MVHSTWNRRWYKGIAGGVVLSLRGRCLWHNVLGFDCFLIYGTMVYGWTRSSVLFPLLIAVGISDRLSGKALFNGACL